MRWLILLVLLTSCSGQAPELTQGTSAQPQETATFYLSPHDSYYGEPDYRWKMLKMNPNEGYIYQLPNAPWGGKLLNVGFTHPADWWLGISDYPNKSWDWNLIEEAFDYSPEHYSPLSTTYIAMWSDGVSMRIPLTYEAPENYIYATIEQPECSSISIDEPAVITFWGKNLQGGQDFYIWYGFWHQDYGYKLYYAKPHPDYPLGIYDVGIRSQPLGEDYIDDTPDSVYAQIGIDANDGARSVRRLVGVNLDELENGKRTETHSYDFLRELDVEIPIDVPLYSTGVVSWEPADGRRFTGQSGALCNSLLTFERSGYYLLWYSVNTTHYPMFINSEGKMRATTENALLFYVSPYPG